MSIAELRAVARLARRGARRSWKRTVLIMTLIAVPVAGAMVAIGFMRTGHIDPERAAVAEFGAAEVRIDTYALSSAVEAWLMSHLDAAPGVRHVQVRTFHSALADGMSGPVSDADPTHPLMEGLGVLVSGAIPDDLGEVALSSHAAQDLGARVGDTVDLTLGSTDMQSYEMTGVVRDPMSVRGYSAVVSRQEMDAIIASAGQSTVALGGRAVFPIEVVTTWLIGGAPPGLPTRIRDAWQMDREEFWPSPAVSPPPPELASLDAEIYVRLNAAAIDQLVRIAPGMGVEELTESALARLDFGPGAIRLPEVSVESRQERLADAFVDDSALSQPPIAGTLLATLLLAEVAMVAGAAYATGTRRRLREIGLLTANGATDAHVRTIVVGEGLVAGLVGAGLGVAAATTFLVLGRSVMQRFVDQLIVGVPLRPIDVVGPMLAGIAAATIAAWAPARTASRVAIITALQGRMPLRAPRRWISVVGFALAGFGALLVIVAKSADDQAAALQAGLGVVAIIGGIALLAGPIVAVIGGFADRFRATPRLVLRDSARQRTRAAAAVAALMIVLVAPIALGVTIGNEQVQQAARGLPPPKDHIVVNGRLDSPTAWKAGAATQEDVAAVSSAVPVSQAVLMTTLDTTVVFAAEQQALRDRDTQVSDEILRAVVGNTELAEILGDTRIAELLNQGRPVVLGVADRPTTIGLDGAALDAAELAVPVLHWGMPRLLLPAGLVDDLGIEPAGTRALLVADHDLTAAERQELWLGEVDVVLSDIPIFTQEQFLWAALGATLLVVLGIIALVTALSATESDHDIATMVAVGAPPAMRRRFLGLQTGLHTLLAGLLAAPLGWLLMKVTATNSDWTDIQPFGTVPGNLVTVPWTAIAIVIVAIPPTVGLLTTLAVRSAATAPPHRAT